MSKPFNPDITVATIVTQDDKFLLVEEKCGGKAVINQPAGHLEPNESLVQGAIRETFEETSWNVEIHYLVGTYLWHCEDIDKTFLRFCFFGHGQVSNPVQPLDSGIIQTLMMTRDDIIKQKNRLRSPLVLRGIDDFLSGQKFPLSALKHIS